jgi:hypothetical protein
MWSCRDWGAGLSCCPGRPSIIGGYILSSRLLQAFASLAKGPKSPVLPSAMPLLLFIGFCLRLSNSG